MNRFDVYIGSITDGLKVGREKRADLAAEFRDHLELLKAEYIKKGFSENESIDKAILSFGEWSDIQMKLQRAMNHYRNTGTVLFGIITTLVILGFFCLPMAGLTIAYHGYGTALGASGLLLANTRFIPSFISLFIPLGYFLPIVSNRFVKLHLPLLIPAFLGILVGMIYSMAFMQCINAIFALVGFALGVAGGMAGYGLLIVINKLFTVLREHGLGEGRTNKAA